MEFDFDSSNPSPLSVTSNCADSSEKPPAPEFALPRRLTALVRDLLANAQKTRRHALRQGPRHSDGFHRELISLPSVNCFPTIAKALARPFSREWASADPKQNSECPPDFGESDWWPVCKLCRAFPDWLRPVSARPGLEGRFRSGSCSKCVGSAAIRFLVFINRYKASLRLAPDRRPFSLMPVNNRGHCVKAAAIIPSSGSHQPQGSHAWSHHLGCCSNSMSHPVPDQDLKGFGTSAQTPRILNHAPT